MNHLTAVPSQRPNATHDHPTPDALLGYQMRAMAAERNLPSGSRAVVFTPAQLDDLALKYRGDDSPLGQGIRLLLDLDERPVTANPQEARAFTRGWSHVTDDGKRWPWCRRRRR